MKNTIPLTRWLGAGAVALALPLAAAAQEAYTRGDANLRAGPSNEYPLVARLAPEQPLQVVGCTDGYAWCDVVLPDGLRGWVRASRLDYAYDGDAVPLATYGATIGVPIIGFALGSYWSDYYRDRPWYREPRWWGNRPPPPPMPGWRPAAPPALGWAPRPPGPGWHGGSPPRPDWNNGMPRPRPMPPPQWEGRPNPPPAAAFPRPIAPPVGNRPPPRFEAQPRPMPAPPAAMPRPQPPAQAQPQFPMERPHAGVPQQMPPHPQGGPAPGGRQPFERRQAEQRAP